MLMKALHTVVHKKGTSHRGDEFDAPADQVDRLIALGAAVPVESKTKTKATAQPAAKAKAPAKPKEPAKPKAKPAAKAKDETSNEDSENGENATSRARNDDAI